MNNRVSGYKKHRISKTKWSTVSSPPLYPALIPSPQMRDTTMSLHDHLLILWFRDKTIPFNMLVQLVFFSSSVHVTSKKKLYTAILQSINFIENKIQSILGLNFKSSEFMLCLALKFQSIFPLVVENWTDSFIAVLKLRAHHSPRMYQQRLHD